MVKSTNTPSKSMPVKKCLLDTPEGERPVHKLVQVFSPVRKTTWKSSRKTLTFGQEKETSEKESHDNLDQLLNIDNLPQNGLHVKVVLKTSSGNVLRCGSRILKWGVNFCNNQSSLTHILHLNQKNQILFQYLRDKKKKRKKGSQKKGGENSPISPPLDPRLVLMRTPCNERTKSLVRQICDQNMHAAGNTAVKHSEVYPYVLNTVKENASDKNVGLLKILKGCCYSIILLNKPYEITGFSNPIFFEEMQIFCPGLLSLMYVVGKWTTS